MFKAWQCGRFTLDLSETRIMGVLNCTPDSFSDGGKFTNAEKALQHAEQMIVDGVDIIDIGAESTRPGALEVSPEEEIERLMPVVKALVADGRKPISIDTKHAKTMEVMLTLGVDMINDVHGLEDVDAIEVVKKSDCGVCLMHMRGMPANMQEDTDYLNVVAEVDRYLQSRATLCEQEGITANRLMIDPGFGFGKTPEQNMALLRQGDNYAQKRYPVLIGASRKSTIGYFLDDRDVADRLIGSVALSTLSAWLGVHMIRVHDVREMRDALAMVRAVKKV